MRISAGVMSALAILSASISGCDGEQRISAWIREQKFNATFDLKQAGGGTIRILANASGDAWVPVTIPGVRLAPADSPLCRSNESGSSGSVVEAIVAAPVIGLLLRLHQTEGEYRLTQDDLKAISLIPNCPAFKTVLHPLARMLGGTGVPELGPQRQADSVRFYVPARASTVAMALEFPGNRMAVFETGVPAASLASLRDRQSLSVPAATTGQNVGLEVKQVSRRSKATRSTDSVRCTATRRARVCVDNHCYNVSISEPGRRTVTYSGTQWVTGYRLTFQNPARQALGTLEFNLVEGSSTPRYGACIPSSEGRF